MDIDLIVAELPPLAAAASAREPLTRPALPGFGHALDLAIGGEIIQPGFGAEASFEVPLNFDSSSQTVGGESSVPPQKERYMVMPFVTQSRGIPESALHD